MGDNDNYGSYAVLGNLSIQMNGLGGFSDYARALDLQTGLHKTVYKAGDSWYNMLRGRTYTDIGMIYEAAVTVVGDRVSSQCSDASLVIPAATHNHVTLVLAAGTDFDQSKGNAENNYSFRGADPHTYVENVINTVSCKSSSDLLSTHIADYEPLASAFSLDLPDTQHSQGLETADLVDRYNANTTTAGDPYLEARTFDFARHLFISSSRNGSLPPNLQSRWSTDLASAWGADYHANINLQMNHWAADQTGLGELQTPLWEYLSQNWAPRGAETAKLLYNASGWVVHNEMNIFGFSAMKSGDEIWANYPISAAWMMQHVWDYYEYSQDESWLRETGYPMLKSIAQSWLSQLQEDEYFKDGTLVINPCTSAEHGPTTFGCTHYQQLIYQVFETTLQSSAIVDQEDEDFVHSLRAGLENLDKGLHIGSWGQIQEWKMDLDVKNDTHRHLSNLIGWHPGWSISSYQNGYSNDTIRNAVATTLYSRGIGIIDSNAGWEKVWRAACWARLNDAMQAYYELRLTITENWAGNLLSMYSGKNLPFQIDANFGFAGAVLAMLVYDVPVLSGLNGTRSVVLGPAIPPAWGNGSVKGLRLRGGGSVDFAWDGEGIVTEAKVNGRDQALKLVNKNGVVLAEV
ncbi:Alpha-fucosidase A [Pseudocercospora fuligena]|uniref:Alpha-fucosidase A n=1 Tax=Pseudocercospora fuligena TaxID=685502 RepID=A0A8H6VHF7_9PEZI|nr:Alpha-fucosidase A [Pseudocercospora fuligena]